MSENNLKDVLGDSAAEFHDLVMESAEGVFTATGAVHDPGSRLVLSIVLVGSLYLTGLIALLSSFRFVLWLLISVVLVMAQTLYGAYQVVRIAIGLSLISTMKFWETAYRQFFVCQKSARRDKTLKKAASFSEFNEASRNIDEACADVEAWRFNGQDFSQGPLLSRTTKRLQEAREQRNTSEIQFLLSGLLKRNHLGIHDENLYKQSLSGTKQVIEVFQTELELCLKALLASPDLTLEEKLQFFKKERRGLGQSALCLSGGGSVCMYHVGVLKALIEAGLYTDLRVISGTSGGSIIAAMMAAKNEEELRKDVISRDVSTNFKKDGSQGRLGIRWFPAMQTQLINFLKTRVLVDNNEFKRCCRFYYGDMTFEEAYKHTKKHVSISVSTSQIGSSTKGPQKLLLNHISTPHVTLASAVAASCSLPGIMLPNKLEAKDASGNLVSFDFDGVDFVDGSILADLPFKRIGTLFNVSNFIVSQVNFHVAPFLHKLHSPNKSSLYWRVFSYLEFDTRSRAQGLASMGLLPTFFGQEVSGVFKQKYHGDITIVPKFKVTESIGLKAVFNPTAKDMDDYIKGGEKAAWPHINRIRFMLRTECALRDCLSTLQTSASGPQRSLRSGTLDDDEIFMDGDDDASDMAAEASLETELQQLRAENCELRRRLQEISHLATAPPK